MIDESAGADVVMTRPDITHLSHLRGRRIAVENTATGALMLSRTLDAAGLRPEDVAKVPLSGPMLVHGYEHNEVDAVVCFEPHATHLAKLGAWRLIDSNRFPGVIVDVLVAKRAAVVASPTPFSRLVAGYFQALLLLQTSPSQTTARMAPSIGLSPPELTQALKGVRMASLGDNRAMLVGNPLGLLDMAQSVSALMVSTGLLKTNPNLGDLVDPRFLPAA